MRITAMTRTAPTYICELGLIKLMQWLQTASPLDMNLKSNKDDGGEAPWRLPSAWDVASHYPESDGNVKKSWNKPFIAMQYEATYPPSRISPKDLEYYAVRSNQMKAWVKLRRHRRQKTKKGWLDRPSVESPIPVGPGEASSSSLYSFSSPLETWGSRSLL